MKESKNKESLEKKLFGEKVIYILGKFVQYSAEVGGISLIVRDNVGDMGVGFGLYLTGRVVGDIINESIYKKDK